jgi:hypothetical protein
VQNFNKKIFILDDVLTKNDCDTLISIYNTRGPTHQWGLFYPMSISSDDQLLMSFVRKVLTPLRSLLSVPIDVDWCEVVMWPEHSYMNPHNDNASTKTVFTSVTYLNNDYTGGYTYLVDDIEFKPKTGRTVFFDGQYYDHGVSPVIGSLRYTLPIWYKLN